MAQLVKLQDYVSRYQSDLKRYPTQFVRLKRMQWERMKSEWQSGEEIPQWEHEEIEEKPHNRFIQRILSFKRKKKLDPWEESNDIGDKGDFLNDLSEELHTQPDEDVIPEEETAFMFQPTIIYYPQTIEELKKMYIDQLFQFQLKWASSTLREKSYVEPKYYRDSLLRAFTQRLPDSYFLFYYPILQVKKAPVELGIILLTPTDCYCIQVLEEEVQAVFVGDSNRFWKKKVGKIDKKVLSPLIGLNRMESVIKQIFRKNEIDLPIRKVVLSRNGYIDYPGSSFGVEFVDKRKYTDWFSHLSKNPSPMKLMQFKAVQFLLDKVQTTSYHRLDSDDEPLLSPDHTVENHS
ncbi:MULTISPECIES: NERD domain-containing protein [unclassified Rummeliibacillus]|uniref:NERD domain-containing protein n=1 Tax=unclassified Rummeliibacillus TaxID=2622809 RepID=UPI000E676629|nr:MULTISPECIES: NERD domain-containing protein [unclassified Rummeliibacillus]RIJ66677.1 NERD domain-containing protein [Rummeliibacillus sp. POC4]RPJ95865.1 NERD domain-containing protein [Rummeliibacillus sp. TYF005]